MKALIYYNNNKYSVFYDENYNIGKINKENYERLEHDCNEYRYVYELFKVKYLPKQCDNCEYKDKVYYVFYDKQTTQMEIINEKYEFVEESFPEYESVKKLFWMDSKL